jgi:hypothetical protein
VVHEEPADEVAIVPEPCWMLWPAGEEHELRRLDCVGGKNQRSRPRDSSSPIGMEEARGHAVATDVNFVDDRRRASPQSCFSRLLRVVMAEQLFGRPSAAGWLVGDRL